MKFRRRASTWTLSVALVVLLAAVIAESMPQQQQRDTTTIRTPPPMKETLMKLTGQLMAVNATSTMNFDTRTPPRVRQQMLQAKVIENSHPGIAVPVEDEDLMIEEAEKKLNFYKVVDRPTTDSGISTWILLSGHSSSTTSGVSSTTSTTTTTTQRPLLVRKEEGTSAEIKTTTQSATLKPVKPIFKRRPISTTRKPLTKVTPINTDASSVSTTKASTTTATVPPSTASATATTTVSLAVPKIAAKLKPSVISTSTTIKNSTKKVTTSTSKPKVVNSNSDRKKPATEFVKVPIKVSNANTLSRNATVDSKLAGPEAKVGGLELSAQGSKKTRRPSSANSTKKKKIKTKRKNKPQTAQDKLDTIGSNSTKVAAVKTKTKPFGTQIYNYLSREVMPTVGVGLVGLMVTAGLASYFLYPFGALRRSYDVDRKDKDVGGSGIYYKDPMYGGGVAEEEMIGKVIAGMPIYGTNKMNNGNSSPPPNANYNNRIQGSRNQYRYRHVGGGEPRPLGTVETVELPYANAQYKVSYTTESAPAPTQPPAVEIISETASIPQQMALTQQQFVVGNVPKEHLEAQLAQIDVVTPAAVPEHGPRRRRRRSRRQTSDIDNEIDSHIGNDKIDVADIAATIKAPSVTEGTTTHSTTTQRSAAETTTTSMYEVSDKLGSILSLLRDLFYYKIRLGLEILQNKTASMSRYISRMQERIDLTYRDST